MTEPSLSKQTLIRKLGRASEAADLDAASGTARARTRPRSPDVPGAQTRPRSPDVPGARTRPRSLDVSPGVPS